VQAAAATAIQTQTSFQDVLAADAQVKLTQAQLASAFDLSRVLRHAGRAIDALLAN
jgi:hypothetical protein